MKYNKVQDGHRPLIEIFKYGNNSKMASQK